MATFEEVSVDLKDRIKKIQDSDKLLLSLAREIHILTFNRIFLDGKMTNGGRWKYSTKSILAGRSSFSTKAGFEKFAGSKKKRAQLNWATIKKGGKEVRLFEVAGGFWSIKQADGHTNPFDFTGQLKKAYLYEGGKGFAIIGFVDTRRLTPDGKPTTTSHADVRQGLEDKQGPIFQLTKEEEPEIDKIIDQYLDSILG